MSAYVLFNGVKPVFNPLSQMIRSFLSRFFSTPTADTRELFCILEYNGISTGWTITAQRKGFERAASLKDRFEITRPNKLFKLAYADTLI